MKKRQVTKIFRSEKRFPLFCHYRGQISPQSAYITLDLDTGAVDAEVNGEIGNSISWSVFNGVVLRFEMQNDLHTDDVHTVIDDLMPTLQKILDESEILWDGNNWKGVLTERGQELVSDLDYDRHQYYIEPTHYICSDLGDYLHDDIYPDNNQSVDDFIQEILDGDGNNEFLFVDELSTFGGIKDALIDIWDQYVYDDDMPSNVRNFLESVQK